MKLNVILPCYNGAETIAQQLDALATQRYSGKWQVIVVNNGSTDHSMEIVEQYRDRLPGLQIVQAHIPPAPLLGVTHSYNVGLAAADGDAFAFCEADDEICEGWVSTVAQALQHHDVIAGPLEHTQLNARWQVEAFGEGSQLNELPRFYLADQYTYASGCNIAFRRSVYETLGPLDESIRYVWDADFCWQAQAAGFDLAFVPGMRVNYRLPKSLSKIYGRVRRWCIENVELQRRYNYSNAAGSLLRVQYWAVKHSLFTAWGWLRYKLGGSRAPLAKSLHELGGCMGRLEGNFKRRPRSSSAAGTVNRPLSQKPQVAQSSALKQRQKVRA